MDDNLHLGLELLVRFSMTVYGACLVQGRFIVGGRPFSRIIPEDDLDTPFPLC